MSARVEYLDADDLMDLATLLLGEPPPVRDLGLLSSAAARPATSSRILQGDLDASSGPSCMIESKPFARPSTPRSGVAA